MATLWLDDREQRAWWAFLDLVRQLGAGMEQQLSGSDISGADYQVLAPLSDAPEGRDAAAGPGRVDGVGQQPPVPPRAPDGTTRPGRPGTAPRRPTRSRDLPDPCSVSTPSSRLHPDTSPGSGRTSSTWLTADELDTLTAISERVISELNRQPPPNHSPDGAFDSPNRRDSAAL